MESESSTYTYKYPHPAVTADCMVFAVDGDELKVLLIQRGNEPYKGKWAFPGGFMEMDETLEECALRELKEETSLQPEKIEQLHAFSSVYRDPRERVITVAFYAVVKLAEVRGGDDAGDARWFPVNQMPPLAFDHEEMFKRALEKVINSPCSFSLQSCP